VSNPTVTFLLTMSKEMLLIATPFELLIGMIVGAIFEIPLVFFLIVTSESPSL